MLLRQPPVMIKDINSDEWKNWFLDLWKALEIIEEQLEALS